MRFDPETVERALAPLAARLIQHSRLTPAERAEVLRIAQGCACKDSAADANVSPETIRARRKRIYRKLGVSGANELISVLLAEALAVLAKGEALQREAPAVGATVSAETGAAAAV